jgi:hypothetical protein
MTRRPVDTAVDPLVTRTREVEKRVVGGTAWAVGITDPVGCDEPSELSEELPAERLVAAEALRLGDKAEQPLRIATRECKHGSLNDTSNDVWIPGAQGDKLAATG